MILEDLKRFFCELINELFGKEGRAINCKLNCNCNK